MAIRKEVDGVYKDVADVLTPIIDGARKSFKAVRKKIDGAWQDIWVSMLPVTLSVSNEFYTTNPAWFIGEGNTIWFLIVPVDNCDCYIKATGEFTNPVITFDVEVESEPVSVSDSIFSHWNTRIKVQGLTSSGTWTTDNNYLSFDAYTQNINDSVSRTLVGSFTAIRIVADFDDNDAGCGLVDMYLKDIKIDGKPYGTNEMIQA